MDMEKLTRIMLLAVLLVLGLPLGRGQAAEPDLTASSAILIEASTGRVMYEKNADEELYPASLTKMMTCILALEAGNPQATVTISDDAAVVEESSLELSGGDKISLSELLTGMMLVSDNGAAVAVSQYLASSPEAFAEQMNKKAREIGATHTHFHNPNGLPDSEHYSTARDLAKIAAYGMRRADFRQIVGLQARRINWQQPAAKWILAENTNELLGKFPGITGIKTGWTQAAGGCLAASARRDGVELIAVVLHSSDMDTRFSDAAALLEYGFGQVTAVKGVDKARTEKSALVRDGRNYMVTAHPAEDVYFPLIGGEAADHYSVKYAMDWVVPAPVDLGERIGSLIVCYDNKEVERVPMLADVPVEQGFSLGSFLVGLCDGALQGIQNLLT